MSSSLRSNATRTFFRTVLLVTGTSTGWRRSPLLLAALVGDEAVEEPRHRLVAARLVAVFVLCLEEGDDLGSAHLAVAQPEDVDEHRVADVQQVAEASEDVVVGHDWLRARNPTLNFLPLMRPAPRSSIARAALPLAIAT